MRTDNLIVPEYLAIWLSKPTNVPRKYRCISPGLYLLRYARNNYSALICAALRTLMTPHAQQIILITRRCRLLTWTIFVQLPTSINDRMDPTWLRSTVPKVLLYLLKVTKFCFFF